MPKEPLYPHVPKRREPLFPHGTREGKFIWGQDRSGNYIITHTERPGLFLLVEFNDGLVYSLQKGERKDVDGRPIEIKDTDPGARVFHKMWERAAAAAESERLQLTEDTIDFLASTEGDPIRKFCCRQCGECAPKELLEEGKFLDRISWLRSHYQTKHPGMWGKVKMSNVPDFAKQIWYKEGPVCDCCGVKIPIEEVGDMETWYEPELHSIVFRCLACKVAGKKPRGVGG